MQLKRLGKSGLYVSEFALGGMLFGENDARGTKEAEAIRMTHAFIEQGGNHIDTANVYADGRSEEIIAKALQGGRRAQVTLASKVRFGTTPEQDLGSGLSRRSIFKQIENSLKRLNTDVIDIYYMHGWDPECRIEESLKAFDDLVREGKVRYLGVSNFKAWQVMQSLGIAAQQGWSQFITTQYQYSLVVRDIEYEFISLLNDQQLGLMAWGPLGGGFLTGKYQVGEQPQQGRIANSAAALEEAWLRRSTTRNWRIMEAVQKISLERQVSSAEVALAWLRSQSIVSSILLGARTYEQMQMNLKALTLTLTGEELQLLDKASAKMDVYPYRMMQTYGMDSELSSYTALQ